MKQASLLLESIMDIGLILAIAGLAFGYYWYAAAKKNLRLSVEVNTVELIGGDAVSDDNDLIITFCELIVKNVDKSNFLFWNSGFGPIKKSDFIEDAAVKISIESGTGILRSALVRTSDVRNGVVITEDRDGEICISFQYLEVGQGFNLELVHTGGEVSYKISHGVIGLDGAIREMAPRGESFDRGLLIFVSFGLMIFLWAALLFKREWLVDLIGTIPLDIDNKIALIPPAFAFTQIVIVVFGLKVYRLIRSRCFGEPRGRPPSSLRLYQARG